MAEEKAFAPTATRLRKARRDGDIPRAPELLSLVAFCAGWFTLQQLLPKLANCLALVLRDTPQAIARGLSGSGDPLAQIGNLWHHPFLELISVLVTILAAIACMTIATAKLIGSMGWSSISIKMERLAIGPNLKRIISADTMMATARALFISCIIVVVTLHNLVNCASVTLSTLSLRFVANAAQSEITHGVITILLAGGIFAAFEARAALTQWYRKLRMDHSELRREYREQSADPHQQAQRKRRHRRLLRSRKTEVQNATLVITNPTHIAIALLYNPPEVGVPVIVARAADHAAAEVRAIARRAGVPIIEAVAVARMLYAHAEEGDHIPLEAYAHVAPLVASALAQPRA